MQYIWVLTALDRCLVIRHTLIGLSRSNLDSELGERTALRAHTHR
uniref:Uncharacterized protein n=1 Tax=Arundo donax TaxID=35708 RepID=A0A0A9ERY1_ARUDO